MNRIEQLKKSRVLIAGLGKSGLATARVLRGKVKELFITDTRGAERMRNEVSEASSAGAVFLPVEKVLEHGGFDLVVMSPGLSMNEPFVMELHKRGAEVVAEIEVAWWLLNGEMVAVTGTNGKTTTISLIGSIASEYFADVRVTGNIGVPLIESAEGSTERTVFVTEVSSYQLEGIVDFKPRVAVVLNISEDHLERHKGIEPYAAAKARIMENQDENDFVVLNFDDPFVRRLARVACAKTLFFSRFHRLREGAFLAGDNLIMRVGGEEAEIGLAGDMPLAGGHNLENVMASVLACRVLGIPWEMIRHGVMSFHGLEHRIEKVGQIQGITFVNDSKATNVSACIAAIRAFLPGKVILVLGGDDKGLDYRALSEEILRRVKHVIFLGDGLARVMKEFTNAGISTIGAVNSMEQVVDESLRVAEAGDVVLLSPSSSSFDRYKNFEERGLDFKNEVQRRMVW